MYMRLEPRWDSVQVRAGAVAVARELERRFPDLITANWWKEDRGQPRLRRLQPERPAQDRLRGLVPRPRTGGQVSTPLSWEEVDTVAPDDLTIRTVPERLQRRGDPWADIADGPQSLEPLLEAGRTGPGSRAARRTVAAAVSEGARRAGPRGPEPSEKD